MRREHIARFALPGLLILSILVYLLWGRTGDVFGSAESIRNIVRSQAVLAVLTLGLLVPLVAGQLDLSVGNTAGLASVLTATAYADFGLPVWLGVLVGLGVGLLVGLVNGAVVTGLGVDPFVATLGTASIVFGLISWHTGGLSIIVGIPESVMRFGGGDWLGVPRVFYVLVVVAAGVYYVLEHTPYGRNLHAVGANRQAARLVGIRVRRTMFASFVLSGLLAGLAGVLLLAYSGSGNPQVGSNFTLTAVAAAFLSAAAFRPGQINVAGALVAIYFIAVNITGLQYAGVPEYVDDVFTGLVLVLALALTRFARTRTV